MNQKRRNATATAIDNFQNELAILLEKYNEVFASIRDEEQEAYDNMPESLQYSERGEKMESIISAFDEVVGNFEDVENVMSNMGFDELKEEAEIC